MSKNCKLIIHDQCNATFVGLDPATRRACNSALKFFIHAARHMPAYRLGRWDGCVSFFAINGNTYLNVVDRVLPIIANAGYQVELDDHRPSNVFEFADVSETYFSDNFEGLVWPDHHVSAGQAILMRDYQVDTIRCAIENLQSVIELSTGSGKEQPLDSKIRIPNGWTTMGEIKIGDIVVVPNGSNAKVTGVFPQGIKDVYTITFKDKRTVRAGGEHLWRVQEKKDGPWTLLNTLAVMKVLQNSNRSLSLQLVEAEQLPSVKLPIDPYILGIFLGNGHIRRKIRFSCQDAFLIDKIAKKLPQYIIKHLRGSNYCLPMTAELNKASAISRMTGILGKWTPLTYEFDKLDLFECDSWDKFIPDIFKQGNFEQKLAVLRGIFDINGYVSKGKIITYTTDSERLALDVRDMLRSIGATVYISSKIPTSHRLGVRKFGRRTYTLAIMYPQQRELFTLPRKIAMLNNSDQCKDLNLKIMSVELTSKEECACISIDSPDHLYITDNWVVTHNTIICAALSHLCENYGRTIIIVPNKDLVRQTEADYANIGLDVGVYYGDRKDRGHKHTICTWQSLSWILKHVANGTSLFSMEEFLKDVVCVIIDETHIAVAAILKELLTGPFAKIPIRWGLSGTVPKEEPSQTSLLTSIGPTVKRLAARELMDKGVLANCHINLIQLRDTVEFSTFHEENHYLVTDKNRLKWLSELIRIRSLTGNTLVLVKHIETGKELTESLDGSVFISGVVKSDIRKDSYLEMSTNDNKIIIATYGVASVGINIPRIFNLVMFEPGRSFVRVIQSIGRSIRIARGKTRVEIFDIASTCKYSAKHVAARKKIYSTAQYPFSLEKIDYIDQLNNNSVKLKEIHHKSL